MQNFHPSITALTGDQPAIDAAKKAFRVYAKRADPDESTTDYLFDHTSIVYVMDRDGTFLTSFNHQTEPEKILRILKPLL